MTLALQSSWILRVGYRRGFLALFLRDGSALLYGGPETPVPSWVPGLIAAGTGRRSPGTAYHRLVRGKYDCNRVPATRIGELKAMMEEN